MPSAEKCDGNNGMIIFGTCSSRATAAIWSGPAPPAATSTKSRGSKPFLTETSRTASDMVEIEISRIACAAAVADRAGIGAGALGTDLERTDVIDPGD